MKNYNLIISRKQNTFDNNSKQAEEKIKDELKKEILSKTIFFTEHRIKKEIKNPQFKIYRRIS